MNNKSSLHSPRLRSKENKEEVISNQEKHKQYIYIYIYIYILDYLIQNNIRIYTNSMIPQILNGTGIELQRFMNATNKSYFSN